MEGNNTVIVRSIQTPRDLYDKDGYVGTCVNEYEICDVRLQVASQKLEGYYFIWEGHKIEILPTGELDCHPKGFTIIGEQLSELIRYKVGDWKWEPYCEIGTIKYRVKVPCYHYNTGFSDNFSYTAKHDFDSLEEAKKFLKDVNEQYKMQSSYENHDITYELYELWAEKFESKWYEVEDGYVNGYSKLYKFIPEKEIEINVNL